ncbi:MAG: hypothetical protein B6245_00810 [Desulfobacteraceae bacterium 4572_88]|nr:MAG: hypothetical protein B6245_00810 [Desulfobacteraceae bacterium 4572_88]
MEKSDEDNDGTLETLLSMNGEIFPMDNGYWTKIEAYRLDPGEQIPHGVRYSLTLHDRNNTRILGFDNAHGVKPKKRKYGARKVTWDHRHRQTEVFPYEYESAGQLLEDFWSAVEQIIGKG